MTLKEITNNLLEPNEALLCKYGKKPGFDRQYWTSQLGNPIARGFFEACRQAADDKDSASLEEWLSCVSKPGEGPVGKTVGLILKLLECNGRQDLISVFTAHLHCALLSPNAADFAIEKDGLARKTGLCKNFLNDLAAELRGEDRSADCPRQSFTVLFVDNHTNDPQGVLGNVTLELVTDGSHHLYEALCMAFMRQDDEFLSAKDNARDYVINKLELWDDGWDVRWRLDRPGRKAFPPMLAGNSAGAAFALGLAKLFADHT